MQQAVPGEENAAEIVERKRHSRSRKMSRVQGAALCEGQWRGCEREMGKVDSTIKLNTGSTVYATRGLARPRHRCNPGATLSRSTLPCTSEGHGEVAAEAGMVGKGWHAAVMGHQRVRRNAGPRSLEPSNR